MPARARRRAIQPGAVSKVSAPTLCADLAATELAAHISPPTANTTKLATRRPFHAALIAAAIDGKALVDDDCTKKAVTELIPRLTPSAKPLRRG